MQNRNMYLYRRQGPKKRAKPGPSRKNRGPQKGLPNSARDLLPLIQPATKALAQMLAGRTGASGQLGHARAVLAQTERLVSDRAHNRLNPAEREEFFEQIARLKLTLADAESEAEVQAMEEEAPAVAPAPVDRERLKEMAMALTSPSGPTSYEDRHKADAAHPEDGSGPALSSPASPSETQGEDEADTPVAEIAKPPEDPNQLRLPRAGAERVAIQPDAIRRRTNGRRRVTKVDGPSPRASTLSAPAETEAAAAVAEEAAPAKAAAGTPAPAAEQKLPKGWVIDEEGFVVPGPAA
ncbi:MAG: hypothetical protein OEU92_25720 [Alphaproteobacteria bacterium]|nr:hypothetical protein [Alphaproteobacteria bacterium]